MEKKEKNFWKNCIREMEKNTMILWGYTVNK
jgi:hypothetical protein